ncbi:MAG: hypothetical protein F6K19_03965 [Cyanothece sp. SIO1E1]|nr:hypothetical protein [Cyanothece sp. SIO1E1]
MEPDSIPTELILSNPYKYLGKIHLDWTPQPGAFLEVAGKTYTVLERRHRYRLSAGRYQVDQISLYVQSVEHADERSLIEGRWVLGDATCRFNAHSELLRCAIKPEGPCNSCRFYERPGPIN